MSSVRRRKNFVIFSLVIMLCLIGYINFNLNRQSLLQTSSEYEQYQLSMMKESGMLTEILDEGEVVFIEDDTLLEEKSDKENIDDKDTENEIDQESNADELSIVDSMDPSRMQDVAVETSTYINETLTNKSALTSSAYFIEGRIERDKKRSEMIGYLNDIVKSELTSTEMRDEAQNIKLQVISNVDKEVKVENMIKAKGFDDALVYITESSVSTVVHSDNLTSQEVAQIVDIIQREVSFVPLDNVVIMNKK